MKKIMIVTALVLLGLYVLMLLFFYLKQESILFYPSLTAQDFKYQFPVNFEEKFYDTPNDGRVHSLRFKVENPKGIIFYLHGNAGNLEDWGWVYQNFAKFGYDTEIIDYRTFGKSTGKLSEANMHADANAIYESLKNEYPESQIVIYGRSIGTGIATQLAAKHSPKMLILETPYYNIEDLAKRMAGFLPVKHLLKFKFESNQYITKIKVPIFILHGTLDEVVPYQSGQKLFELVKDHAKFFTFKNGTHANLATFAEYDLFLNEVL